MTIFAMVFPGQGSQSVGMLTNLATDYEIVKTTFSEASSALGYNLWLLVQKGPNRELNKTCITQPALLTASVAIWRVWRQCGGRLPTIMAGHSLGEYSALVCAGGLDFITAIKLVAMRGKLMQDAVPDGIGAMSVIIGLDRNHITDICERVAQKHIVSPVNFNSPNQIVIAGHKQAVERASMACKKAGAKYVLQLPISVPSHCMLMKPAAEKLAQYLEKVNFSKLQIPVVNNVNIRVEYHDINIRQALVRQLYNPVYWTEIVKYIASQGIDLFLEIGPSNVLTCLIKQIDDNLSSFAVNDSYSLSVAIKY